jgi:hypothetical protein
MSGIRTLRDQLAKIERTGLAIAGVRYGRHMKVDLVAPDGRTNRAETEKRRRLITIAGSPAAKRERRPWREPLKKNQSPWTIVTEIPRTVKPVWRTNLSP